MFDLIFYKIINMFREIRSVKEKHNLMVFNKLSFTIKEMNDMELFLDNVGILFRYYMDGLNFREYIISYNEYFNLNIPVYIDSFDV